jgi:hypothetical protein
MGHPKAMQSCAMAVAQHLFLPDEGWPFALRKADHPRAIGASGLFPRVDRLAAPRWRWHMKLPPTFRRLVDAILAAQGINANCVIIRREDGDSTNRLPDGRRVFGDDNIVVGKYLADPKWLKEYSCFCKSALSPQLLHHDGWRTERKYYQWPHYPRCGMSGVVDKLAHDTDERAKRRLRLLGRQTYASSLVLQRSRIPLDLAHGGLGLGFASAQYPDDPVLPDRIRANAGRFLSATMTSRAELNRRMEITRP